MSNATAQFRTFTVEQSSAIASILIEDNQAMIAYQSNPDKVYTFDATDTFINELVTILDTNPIQGLGAFVATARRTGNLKEV